MTRRCQVFLVGAGPGDPDLITLRGMQVLQQADLVLYDYLVNPEILQHAPSSAELVCLGRHGRDSLWAVERIQQTMVTAAQAGKTVVRLKSGDPMVFGRASGELDCLSEAGIAFEIVPGVTAALAAASYAGVPITDRDRASAVAFVTGQERSDKPHMQIDYEALARFPGTLVIYMGITTAGDWTSRLMQAGMPADRPVALIRRCSWPNQQVVTCRLDQVADRVTPYAKFPPPAVAIVGDVARDVPKWSWFQQRPLFGQTVLVTRPRHQASELQRGLRDLGADVLVQPAIEIRPPERWDEVDAVSDRLADFDMLVFSSANGVDQFLGRWFQRGRDARGLGHLKIAAVGPGTEAALRQFHLCADVTPERAFHAESLVEALAGQVDRCRCLLVRASRGREVLAEGLRDAGAIVQQVVAYQSLDQAVLDDEVARRLDEHTVDWVTVTSSAIAHALVRLLGTRCAQLRWASISPLTSAALRQHGIEPAAEAAEATMPGVVDAVAAAVVRAAGA
jgi:uroporphyrinogen III methyltransferase/synthase